MDEEFQSLENELKRLRPRAPTTGLEARIASELSARHRPRAQRATSRGWYWLLAAGVGGSLAALIIYVAASASPKKSSAEVKSVSAPTPKMDTGFLDGVAVQVSEVRWDPKDLGILVVDDRPPVRVVNYQKLTSIKWSDPKGRITAEWMVPSEETEFIPTANRAR